VGTALNLNPHLHVLVADGVFVCRDDGSSPEFMATPAPTSDDLRGVIARVIARLETIARRRGHRDPAAAGSLDEDGMERLRRAAGGRGTFARIDEKGAREDDKEKHAAAALRLSSHGLVAEMGGFNLHAGVRVEADDRDALERLCRYMARPAVATGRVSVLPDGNVAYRVKSPRSGAATHRVMTPMEFMARLAALVPPPRTPLVRYHGVLAPNSPWRVAVVPLPPVAEKCGEGAGKTAAEAAGGVGGPETPTKRSRIDWARLLWRVEGRRRAEVSRVRGADEDDRGGHRARGHRPHPGAPRASRPVVPRMRRARDGP
jgi:hypothetical protein